MIKRNKIFITVLKNEGGDYCDIFVKSVGDVEEALFDCVVGNDIKKAAEHAVRLWGKYFHNHDAVIRVGKT